MVATGRPAGAAAPRPSARGAPILDTTTPELGHSRQRKKGRKHPFGKVSRRLFSRVLLGLQLPGRYYFLTLTTTPKSPALKKVWDATRKWLHRYRPGMVWIYCFTTEGKGQGVIHMVIRLGTGEERLDVNTVRSWWERLTGARQLRIVPVRLAQKNNLAEYLRGQKKKRSLGREMSYQSSITRWRYSTGWLPKGFAQAFGKFWAIWHDAPSGARARALNHWLHRAALRPEEVKKVPRVIREKRG